VQSSWRLNVEPQPLSSLPLTLMTSAAMKVPERVIFLRCVVPWWRDRTQPEYDAGARVRSVASASFPAAESGMGAHHDQTTIAS
jgi:hypothetical protein